MKYNLLKSAILLKTSKKVLYQMIILLLWTSTSYANTNNTFVAQPVSNFTHSSVTELASVVVKGKVTDEKGSPAPGVSVKIKGTNLGVATDIDGNYTLTVPSSASVLVFTIIGYQQVEKTIGSQTIINVQLEPTDKNLNEVVVIGYGTQKKVDLTGAVSVISGKTLNERVVTDPLTLLQGQAPGLQVVQNSGEPGNNGAVLRIRGFATFQANADPLIVVDGIPLPGVGNIQELNPNDIETISVLKDAASASIYGSRGANGVILVTTKKGAANGKINLDYAYNAGIVSPTRLLNIVDNSVEYLQMFNTAAAHVGNPSRYSDAFIARYAPGGDLYGTNVNWQNLIFSRVVTHNHYLSLNGTTGETKYNVSLGYIDEPGIMLGLANKKYTLQLGLNSTVNKTINMGVNINMNYNDRRTVPFGSQDEYISAITQPPLWGAYTLDGSGNFTDTNNSDPTGNYHNKNYFAVTQYAIQNVKTYNGIANLFVDVKLLKNLVWETRGGVNFQYGNTNRFAPQVKTYNYYTGLYTANLDLGTQGLTITETTNINPVLYSQFTYNQKFGNHSLSILGGAQYEYNYNDQLGGFRNGFLAYETTIRQLNGGATAGQTNNSSSGETANEALYGRLNYNYKERYLFEANARYDGSSRFAPGNEWALFPSFSAAWRITEEPFFKKLGLNYIDEFKIKGSWGKLGNQNIGTYPYQTTLSLGSGYPIDNSGVLTTNVTSPNLVDNTIKWETSTSTDVGFESMFFNKLTAGFDYYNRTNTDLLRTAQISAYKGLNAPTINYGIMNNKGFEITLGYHDRKGDFSYGVNLNFERNINTLIKYGTPTINSTSIIEEGHEYNQFYLYKWIGIFQSAADIAASPKQPNNPKPGDLKYADINGDGVIDSRDRTYFSGLNPTFDYSVNLNFAYKAFDLSMYVYAVRGQKNYVSNFGAEPFVQNEPPLKSFRDAWSPTNPSNTVPALYIASYAPDDALPSTYFLQDASFIKIKNLQLGYNFPANFTKKIGIKNVRIYAAVDNLAVFTKFPELDPERTGALGTQLTVYPQNRTISVGAKIKF